MVADWQTYVLPWKYAFHNRENGHTIIGGVASAVTSLNDQPAPAPGATKT